jgi:hypothetical protein
MKTAKELNDIGQRIYWLIEDGRAGEVIRELQAVQLDAMKEGMRRAAKVITPDGSNNRIKRQEEGVQAILTAAKQLTDKGILQSICIISQGSSTL